MRKSILSAIFLAACLTATALHAKADNDPLQDPGVQKTLRAMGDASTWYHPDLFGEFTGSRLYAHHNFKGALKYFKIGAYYSDKFSQMCIGLMYANGEGVAKDLPTAYAWLAVAAERHYPQFEATRDRIKAQLSPEQLAQAEKILAGVQAKYGDQVAKHRLIGQLAQGRMQMSGSHTGFDSGMMHPAAKENCAVGSVIGGQNVPVAGCGSEDIYAPERWEPKLYFAMRDSQWKATVSVGAINDVGSANKAKPAGKNDNAKPDDKKQ